MSELPPPTHEVERLVAIIGAEATLRLVEARSAARVYVPRTHDPESDLAQLIGDEAAAALTAAAPGDYFKVPVARTWRVLVYASQRCSYADIARRVGCSQNTVWRILNEHQLTHAQLDMFR
jgi:hypothetical protein